MQARTTSPSVIFPGLLALDDLELLRWGALPADWTVRIDGPTGSDGGHNLGGTAIMTDAEGAPFAEVDLEPDGRVVGTPRTLGDRSARPFADLHVPPDAVTPVPVVTLSHPVDPRVLEQAVADHPECILLCFASLDGEPDPVSLDTVRQALRAAGGRAGLRVVVAPVLRDPSIVEPRREAVVSAYSRGHEVVNLSPASTAPAEAGTVLFFTGLSGSGKSTVARAVRNYLLESTQEAVSLLDGDVIRRNLSKGLGFSAEDRDTNIRRIGWVAGEIAYHGGLAICSPIAPFDDTRRAVRAMVESRGGRFLLVHVATPLEECERRDRKGLYAKARRGEIPEFTGISSPYEAPTDADLVIDTTGRAIDELRDQVLALLPIPQIDGQAR